jgi:branched-chain amino acid transport system ATP-binding protein
MSNILEIKNLEVDYGITKAIKGINMIVPEGSIVAILGSNGAGKTSTIKAISGMVKVKKGEILFREKLINNMAPYKMVKLGISQSPEGRMILVGLSVEDNLKVGAYALKSYVNAEGVRISKRKRLQELLEEVYGYFPILKERSKQQASTLSGGEQQMLAIGRALMGAPDLLLLDEPSLGLAPLIIKEIFQIIQKIKESGRTILIVEQNARQALKIANYGYVLEVGKVKTEGKGLELLNNQELVEAYLGSK